MWIGGNLYVTGNTVTVNSMEISGNLTASGNTVLGDNALDTFTVTGTSTFNGGVAITGSVSANSYVGLPDMTEQATFNGDKLINGNLTLSANKVLDVATISHNSHLNITANGNIIIKTVADQQISMYSEDTELLRVSDGFYFENCNIGLNTVNYVAVDNPSYNTIRMRSGADGVTLSDLMLGSLDVATISHNGALDISSNSGSKIIFNDSLTLSAVSGIDFQGSDVTISPSYLLNVATVSHNGGTTFNTCVSIEGTVLISEAVVHASEFQIDDIGKLTNDTTHLYITSNSGIIKAAGTLDVATISHNTLTITANDIAVTGTVDGVDVSVLNGEVSGISANVSTNTADILAIQNSQVFRFTSASLTSNTAYTVNHALNVTYPQVVVISANKVIVPNEVTYSANNYVIVDFSGNTVDCYVTVIG
jgi:hypothetical protein